jgi:glyoxylate carboligase
MGRRLLLITVVGLVACDKSGPLADLDAGTVASPTVPPPSAASATVDAAPPDAGRLMPPRPVPTSSPTVLITMPIDVQLKAIQYMAAMQAPQPGDAPADPTYAKSIADSLRGAGRPDVVSSGRRIDLLLEKGCDASLPRQVIARSTGASLTTLLAHGVLVVRCADHALQCLQSTRDADDVLCTRK